MCVCRLTWVWRCRVEVPDGCFGYGAVEQRAQPPVKTSDPMTVHRLLHTVNYRGQKKRAVYKTLIYCTRIKRFLLSGVRKISICFLNQNFDVHEKLWRRDISKLLGSCSQKSTTLQVSADKQSLCQSSQAAIEQITKTNSLCKHTHLLVNVCTWTCKNMMSSLPADWSRNLSSSHFIMLCHGTITV